MADWYVAPHVVTEGNGQIGSPWSLAYAFLGAPVPGAPTMRRLKSSPATRSSCAAASTARTTGYDVKVQGAPGARLRFVPYPGEAPLLDGTLAAYWQGSGTAWEAFGQQRDGHHVYRTIAQLPEAARYKGLIDVDGVRLTLIPYDDRAFFESDVHTWNSPDPWYVGPGIWWDGTERRLYIRLDNSTREAQAYRDGVTQIADPDPNRYAIRLGADEKRAIRSPART